VQPTNCAGREVTAAWSITGSEEVFVANSASGLTIASTSRHISSFSGRLSVIASITMSQSRRSPYSIVPEMRPRMLAESSSESLPFSTARASCFSILPTPFASVSSSTSRTTTS
jgi:hypothetical protein